MSLNYLSPSLLTLIGYVFHFILGKGKQVEALNILAAGFLRGGLGFLKSSAAGEMIKGSGHVNREIRVGVTHVRNSVLFTYFLMYLM